MEAVDLSNADISSVSFVHFECGRHFFSGSSLHMAYYRMPWYRTPWYTVPYIYIYIYTVQCQPPKLNILQGKKSKGGLLSKSHNGQLLVLDQRWHYNEGYAIPAHAIPCMQVHTRVAVGQRYPLTYLHDVIYIFDIDLNPGLHLLFCVTTIVRLNEHILCLFVQVPLSGGSMTPQEWTQSLYLLISSLLTIWSLSHVSSMVNFPTQHAPQIVSAVWNEVLL